jgi:hypothetical protein
MGIPADASTADVTPSEVAAKKTVSRRLLVFLAWLVVCGGLLAWLVMAVRAAREAVRCQECCCHLRLIGCGLRNFDVTTGSLPPAYLCDQKGKPIHSWHTLLFPFLGHYGWRGCYMLTEPWDGPNNRRAISYTSTEFQCRSAGDSSRLTTDYVAVVGPDTMWPGSNRVVLSSSGNRDTILLIEMPDSDYRCLEPRFPTVDEFLAKIKSPTGHGIRSIHPKGLAYLTVGGDVRWFPPDTDIETIRRLLKRDPNCTVLSPKQPMEIIEHWEQSADEGK